jgi:hypothetical protein
MKASNGSKSSEWKRHANRCNSEKSTGPRTVEGKQASSQNATTHGVFCNALLLDGEDGTLLHRVRQDFIKSLKPQDLFELSFVDRIVAQTWKLRRLREAELRLHASEASGLREGYYGLLERLGVSTDASTPIDGSVTLAANLTFDRNPFDRATLLEQRLDNATHRCVNQLRKLRADRGVTLAELPDSPFLNEPLPEPEPAAKPHDERNVHSTSALSRTRRLRRGGRAGGF